MRTVPKGLIATSAATLLPLAQVAKKRGFDSIFDRMAIATVKSYQKHISPYKGFRCAHRTLYSSDSCSQYFRRMIAQEGLVSAIPLFQKRLEECKAANLILQAERRQKRRQKRNWQCVPDCDCEPECDCGDCDCGDCDCDCG